MRCRGNTQKGHRCKRKSKTDFCYQHKASKGAPQEVTEDCTICLQSLSRPTVLSCTHQYHKTCLRLWAAHSQTCPLCRANFSWGDKRMLRTTRSDDENDNDEDYLPSPSQRQPRRVPRRRNALRSSVREGRQNMENRGILFRLLDALISSAP